MDYGRKKIPLKAPGASNKLKRLDFHPTYRKYIIAAVLFLFVAFFMRYAWREMRFRYIVIHHTASDIGNMEYYRRLHMKERGWPDIAYHFIINNGTYNTAMGQIEESGLWKEREINYSTKVSYVNYFGIAVALVGNFEQHSVSPLQWESLVNLATMLAVKYSIPPERIIAHRELWETACPGKHFDINKLRSEIKKNMDAENQ